MLRVRQLAVRRSAAQFFGFFFEKLEIGFFG
jgi:hypothetical protein